MLRDPLTTLLAVAILVSAAGCIYLLVTRSPDYHEQSAPDAKGDPVKPTGIRAIDERPERTYRYRTGMSTVRLVSAHECDIYGGRVTWRDLEGRIVLSLPSDAVHALTCLDSIGLSTDPILGDHIVAADRCDWCSLAIERGRFDNRHSGHHFPDCPHRSAR